MVILLGVKRKAREKKDLLCHSAQFERRSIGSCCLGKGLRHYIRHQLGLRRLRQ